MKRLSILLLLFLSPAAFCQYLPVHPTHGVYPFLDELANERLLDLSSYAKPLSFKQITEALEEVDVSRLNQRQSAELKFYQREFLSSSHPLYLKGNGLLRVRPDREINLFRYNDSLSTENPKTPGSTGAGQETTARTRANETPGYNPETGAGKAEPYSKSPGARISLRVNPILGSNYYKKAGGSAWHWWNGAGADMTIGRWAFSGSLRDNHESEFLTYPTYLNQNYGGANFKNVGEGGKDYWEFRGGVSYDFGIGSIGLYKDHFSWGSHYNGASIFSGRPHSFAHIAFNLDPVKWFSFRYVHGWLVSEVVDSSRSFYVNNSYERDYREMYHSKYLAANLFTVRPVQGLDLSFGNSIIYDYDTPHPVYFIPFMFYKAVDHHLSSRIDNMNSQMFVDASVRLIPKVHLYGTLFVDELAVKRIFKENENNFLSWKGGFRLDNLLPNTFAGAELSWTNTLTYQHYVTTTTFESNRFNLGHYLTDNARELYFYLGFRPFRASRLLLSYTSVDKGPDHTLLGTESRVSIKELSPIVWESDKLSLKFSMELWNNVHVRMGYTHNHVRGEDEYLQRFGAKFWRGKFGSLEFGGNLHF